MSEQDFVKSNERMDAQLRATAPAFPYPPTPDLQGAVSRTLANTTGAGRGHYRRRAKLSWALVAVLLLIVLAALLAVPQVQAFVRSLFRIGAIEVVVVTPVPTNLSATPTLTSVSGFPDDIPTPNAPLDLAGETTLDAARSQVPFTINLPAYPADLGKPDRVFVQDLNGPALILAWTEHGNRDLPRLVLYELSSIVPNARVTKGVKEASAIQETMVNGREAIWITGPHWLQFINSLGLKRNDTRYLVEGNVLDANVLLWDTGGTTYRLETDFTLEEATHLAGSLTPMP